jgi:hypothetical protein
MLHRRYTHMGTLYFVVRQEQKSDVENNVAISYQQNSFKDLDAFGGKDYVLTRNNHATVYYARNFIL